MATAKPRNKRISQADARNAIKRCHELEDKLRKIVEGLITIPEGSVAIANVPHEDKSALLPALIRQSNQFGHAVICSVDDAGTIIYYALERN